MFGILGGKAIPDNILFSCFSGAKVGVCLLKIPMTSDILVAMQKRSAELKSLLEAT